MPHFSRIRSAGFWTLNSVLTPSEMESFDANQSKAINGDEGGAWAPTDPIEIGAEGITVTGTFIVTSEAQLQGGATVTGGDLAVAENASVQGTLTVDGASTLTGNVSTDGDVNCERLSIHGTHYAGKELSLHGDAQISGDVQIDSSLSVTGVTALNNDTTVDADLEVTNNLTVGGILTAALSTGVTLTGAVVSSSAGRIRKRYLALTDADTTVDVATYDIVQMANAVMTTSRTVVLTTTGAGTGDTIMIVNDDTGDSLEVKLNSLVGTTVATLINSGGGPRMVQLVFSSGAWHTLYTA